MKTAFILIIWWMGTSGSPAIDHIRFEDRPACEAALQAWNGEGICVAERSNSE